EQLQLMGSWEAMKIAIVNFFVTPYWAKMLKAQALSVHFRGKEHQDETPPSQTGRPLLRKSKIQNNSFLKLLKLDGRTTSENHESSIVKTKKKDQHKGKEKKPQTHIASTSNANGNSTSKLTSKAIYPQQDDVKSKNPTQ
ncbi:hypothetical protein FRC11_010083, partial [Ceratobasidium sp. 423]